MKTFEINSYKYVQDLFGIVHQLDPEPFEYGEDYISCYDSPEYVKNNTKLQKIRWNIVQRATKGKKILDYGAGRGEFGKHAPKGYKVENYDVGGVMHSNDYNIITMWDVLEHIPDLNEFLDSHYPKYYVISLPLRPALDEMADWKHLKPNEHLHHFDLYSLMELFGHIGYNLIWNGNNEDEIRKSDRGNRYNILTTVFCR